MVENPGVEISPGDDEATRPEAVRKECSRLIRHHNVHQKKFHCKNIISKFVLFARVQFDSRQ